MTDAKINIANLVLVVSNDCPECRIMEEKLIKMKGRSNFALLVVDRDLFNQSSSNIKVLITPALFLNGTLKLYGDAPEMKLNEIISNKT